ncbi:MAG: SURF1 family protein [Gemmatimonadales bacterium]|nr:SURF1 family protein [Gemmatimonadales bacterium]
MSLRSTPVLVGLILLVTATCLRLGLWQVDRLHQRRAINATSIAQRTLPSLSLNDPLPQGIADPLPNRHVTAVGEFDHSQQVVVRGRVYREAPGVHVVTPLRLTNSDTAVLVNRGFVPAPDAMTAEVDSLDEVGPRRVTGIAFAIPTDADGGTPLVHAGRTTWKRLDLAALRARLSYPILDVYVLEEPDSGLPRYPRRLEPRPIDDGPHLSYAIQWFSFGTIALVGGVILAFHERKRARRGSR